MNRDSTEQEAADTAADEQDPTAAEADHELVMATARRVITSDAAIIHRLGTI